MAEFGFDPKQAVRHREAVDPALGEIIAAVGPVAMELESSHSLFSALSEAIVYQQLSMATDQRSAEQTFDQLVSIELQVVCDIAQYRRQGADLQRIVRWNGYVMLGRSISGEAEMAARLSDDAIADAAKRFRQIHTRKIARQPHAAIT